MLKFGGLIDLEKLERAMIPKKGIEEVKVSLEEQELANREEMRRWHRELAEAKDEVTKMTAQNTACLNAVADLTRRHRDVEAQLKNTQRSVFVDPNAARRVAMAPPGATRGPANEGGGACVVCPRAAVRTRQQKTGASVTAWTTRGR